MQMTLIVTDNSLFNNEPCMSLHCKLVTVPRLKIWQIGYLNEQITSILDEQNLL